MSYFVVLSEAGVDQSYVYNAEHGQHTPLTLLSPLSPRDSAKSIVFSTLSARNTEHVHVHIQCTVVDLMREVLRYINIIKSEELLCWGGYMLHYVTKHNTYFKTKYSHVHIYM